MITKLNRKAVVKKLWIIFAEYVGTGILVFASCLGCTAIQHPVTVVQGSLIPGISVITVIHIFGHISGAHVNPAVSISALIMKQISLPDFFIYVISQVGGALTGYASLMVITPRNLINFNDENTHCLNLPNESLTSVQALIAEMLFTIILILAVCSSWDNRNNNRLDSISLRIGFVVILLNLIGINYTGASMNPARSFGPAVFQGNYHMHWIYWVGPCLGAVITSVIYKKFILYEEKPIIQDTYQ